MTYRPTSDPATWRTLDQIRSEIEETKWYHSRIYEDVEVAIAIGHIHDFWDLPENIQAIAIARFRVRGAREAYEEHLLKRDRPKKKESDPAAMRRSRRRR